ncbi:hypothetical protein C7445_11040 [Alicyclobacillus sacchari]|uniref:3-methylitaconate isomerase n=1 Tax=Alicyclobacillus sacchari TaxID=392010 RepID=A0A4R8LJT1_9BACL|nr:PrpF domain-containing protein [Alicyclobacillus sacchari]TDY43996.1 hypothetical protein C7445_11040 [Alicyclobacillus sacchari]
MAWRTIPCAIYRGGTSKGIIVRGRDIPSDPNERDRVLLRLFGSPDPRQIDGLGGATPTTSKLAIVEVSSRDDADVDYTFGQVSIDKPYIDYRPNCGNISAAVGPFAVNAGLVEVDGDGMTQVRIYNTNTDALIVARFLVQGGRFQAAGNAQIPGVPGAGSPVYLDFSRVAGGVTGRLLPTGKRKDELLLANGRRLTVTIIDAGNLTVLVDAEELGLTGCEIRESEMVTAWSVLEDVRQSVGRMLGLYREGEVVKPETHALPKIAFVHRPIAYRTTDEVLVSDESYDISARVLTMGRLHPTYAVTGAIALVVACKLPGTVAYSRVRKRGRSSGMIRIGHPAGVMEAGAEVEDGDCPKVAKVTLMRTARPLMAGMAWI